MNKKNYTLNEQGSLHFGARNLLHKDRYKPESVWHQEWLLVTIVVACLVMDIASFYQLFSAFLYEEVFLRYCCIIAMLIAFTIAPVYLSYSLKKKKVGYNVENIAIIVPLASFIIGVVINFMLRIVTKDLAFPDLSMSAASAIGSGDALQSGSSSNATFYAVFFGVLPVITALGCFAAAYTLSDPLKKERQKLEKEQIDISENIAQTDAILAEYAADENHLGRLLNEDEASFNAALGMVQKQRDEYFDYVRQRINERLAEPAPISYAVDYNTKNNEEVS